MNVTHFVQSDESRQGAQVRTACGIMVASQRAIGDAAPDEVTLMAVSCEACRVQIREAIENARPFRITVDGIHYRFEVEHDGDIVRVFDCHGQQVALAERDHAAEAVYYDYYMEEEGKLEGHGGTLADLFSESAEELARWLVSTHPNN